MATIKRTKKQNKRISEIILYSLAVLSCFAFIGSKFFIQSYNVTLANEVSSLNATILVEQEKVSTMSLEVKQMENRDRILELVEEDGLTANQDNIVALGD
ncbi:MAG: hypothetical protein ACRCZJ_07850 [Erysipelotrichaceae bacterium]